MKSYYSVIKYVNNSITNETISLGLIAVSADQVFFHLVQSKIELAKKLNSKNYRLLDFSLKQFKRFAENDLSVDPTRLIEDKKIIDFSYLSRLSSYNNGVLQFSKPETIDSEISKNNFPEYVVKLVGEDIFSQSVREEHTGFKNLIKHKLYDPLRDRIDVDYVLKKNQLETLFFDFHLDGIGVNGSLYAAKAIDFNSSRQLAQIRTDISEFESVIERLKRLAERKGLNSDHNFCLIVDQYTGNQPSYNDLYSLLKQDIMPLFKILQSNDVDKFTKDVVKHNARKFSEEIM